MTTTDIDQNNGPAEASDSTAGDFSQPLGSQFIPCLNELVGRKIVAAIPLTPPSCGIALKMDNGKIAVIGAGTFHDVLSCGVVAEPDRDEMWDVAMAGWIDSANKQISGPVQNA